MSGEFKRTTSLARHVTVRPGQIWADCDKRSSGRLLRVDTVTETHAGVYPCNETGEAVPSVLRARRTRIRLDRFVPTSTGFRYVRDAPGGSSGSTAGGTA